MELGTEDLGLSMPSIWLMEQQLDLANKKLLLQCSLITCLDDAGSATKKLGFERAHGGSYLFHSILAGNARLALGSDWPVVDINPLQSMRTAMKRVPPGWENAWISSECISLNDALNAYTISTAHACFLDEDVGSLSPGKMADFVVLSSADSWDKFASGASASIDATYVGGLLAHSTSLEEEDL